MTAIDPFFVFRTALFIGLGVYTVLMLASTTIQFVRLLAGDDPSRHMLRAYFSYQLVTVRLRPLAGELFQIAMWTAILLIIWQLH